MKRKFIGLGRKPKRKNKNKMELPDNFILGFTNQHSSGMKTLPKKEDKQ